MQKKTQIKNESKISLLPVTSDFFFLFNESKSESKYIINFARSVINDPKDVKKK